MSRDDIPAKLEFEVKELKVGDIEKLKASLLQKQGITSIQTVVNENETKVFVETSLPSAVVQRYIESESKTLAILRGMGTSSWKHEKHETAAAVSIISSFDDLEKPVRGVVRFVQLDDSNCAVDGTIDGLKTGYHAINICEYGDISRGCESTGNHFNPFNKKHGLPTFEERHVGDLGNIKTNSHGIASFRLVDEQLKVWDIIGRSFCIYEGADNGDGNAGNKIACGVVARSAGLFENVKKICLCSGKTLWQERDLVDQQSKI